MEKHFEAMITLQTHLLHALAETHTRSEALKAEWRIHAFHALIENRTKYGALMTHTKSEALKTG